MLDVGQGDAILVRTDEKTVLIDAGDRSANTENQLRALGVKRLDLVVSTHPHADHIGRMKGVLESFEVGLYLDNGMRHTTMTYRELMETVSSRKINRRPAVRGMVLRLGDEATLTVYHPGEILLSKTRSDLNSNSVVLLLEHGDNRMLFTGDAEYSTERELMSLDIGDIDLLKVAHHGSSHSSSQAFLNSIKPEIAIISAGHGNRYGHPNPDTLQRLTDSGATVFRTDLSHHIQVISDGRSLEVLEGSLEELTGIKIVLNTPPPEARSVRPPEPAPIQNLPWLQHNTQTTAKPSLSQLLEAAKQHRAAERAECKALQQTHRTAKTSDREKIREAKKQQANQ
jgi:competence protein ComEC